MSGSPRRLRWSRTIPRRPQEPEVSVEGRRLRARSVAAVHVRKRAAAARVGSLLELARAGTTNGIVHRPIKGAAAPGLLQTTRLIRVTGAHRGEIGVGATV